MKQSTDLGKITMGMLLVMGLLWAVTWSGVAIAQGDVASATNAPVKLVDGDNSVTLENGLITLRINKTNANVLSLQYKGMDLVDGSGYWNVYGNSPDGPKTEKKPEAQQVEITQDPASNDGRMGEIKINMPYTGQAGTEPLDIAIRYALRRGDSAIYCWTSVTHKPGYPAFNVEISTVTLKLKADVFDHLNIDSRRDKQMITAQDWFQGKPLNLSEARLMTTGIHTGEVEHKYDYSAVLADTPAWGWTSTKKNVGVWYLVPSLEYINGPPTKVELTGHIDLKNSLPADPTLLFIWQGSHYGGVPIHIGQDEYWNKVVGPFLIYCNTGATPDDMWKNALDRSSIEAKEWPYAWVNDPGYPTQAERGGVRGKLVVKDPQEATASAANAWVGLAAAPYTGVDGNRKPYSITWQIDGKHYQYWVRADKNGKFVIPDARPGTYELDAFNDGILGEFSKSDVTVEAGKTKEVGTLTWVPARYGRQIWQIGTPDRSAAEFRHGDHYWEWGLYNKYAEDFPNGVNFVIGMSNSATDWDYAQPPAKGDDGHWHGTTWHILFDMAKVPPGKATLRLAICGSRGNSVDVSVNGKAIGSTGPLPNSGVMHRDGIRSIETEVDLPFDSSMLVPGKNQIDLTTTATDWTQGVLYDYLRLELAPKNSTVAKLK